MKHLGAGTEVQFSSPYGGLIFFRARKNDAPSFLATISGAYEAPRYLKSTGLFVDGPAPWGEVTGEKFSIFLPRHEIEASFTAGRIAEAIQYWDDAVMHQHSLAKPPYG
jgi:hypothetical protein